jgi:sugar phosphate isomerase/epimerase
MIIANPMVFRQLPLEDAIEKIRSLGFRQLELWPIQLAEVSTPRLRSRFAEFLTSRDLTPIRLNCADRAYFPGWGADFTCPTALDGLRRDIDAAGEMGMKQVLTWEGRPPERISRDDTFGPLLDAATRLLGDALTHAKSQGISLSIEIHPFTVGIDLEWTVALCERLSDPDFGVTYDCCHFAVGIPDGYVDAIRTLGSRIKHVHFSDGDCVTSEVHYAPTTGTLDLIGIIGALREIAFDGSVMLDAWLDPLPEQGLRLGKEFLEAHYAEAAR